LILRSLEINNYGVFKGTHSIEFSQPSIKSVTLIGGLNGSGKTTIFESIQLCMFGSLSELHKEDDRKSVSYNKFLESKINRQSDKSIGTAITLVINITEDSDISNDIKIIRSWKKTTSGIKEQVEVFQNDLLDTDLTDNWIEFISSIISPSLSKLFLFDGEKILKYAEPNETSKLLIHGIQTLMGADLIVNLEDDLNLLKKNILKDANPDIENELKDTENEIDKLKKDRASLETSIAKISDQLKEDKEAYEKLDVQFQAKGFKTHKKIEELEKNIIETKLAISMLEREQLSITAKSLPLKMPTRHMSYLKKELSKHEDYSLALNKISAWQERDELFLKLIKGLPKSETDIIKDTLKQSLQDHKSSMKEEKSTKYLSKIYEINAIEDEIKSDLRTYKSNQKKLVKLNSQLENLEKSLSRAPDDQISKKLFAKRDKLIKNISVNEAKLDELSEKLSLNDSALVIQENRFKKQFDEKIDQLQSSSTQKKQLGKIRLAEKALRLYRNEVITRSLNSFEKMIVQKFKYLNRKDSLIERISVNKSDFVIHVFDQNENEINLRDLSAGERQLLAVSILWTLSELSKTKIPVVIDTPLGRLDSKHRNQLITKYFPEAGSQTVILSTDEEIIGTYYKSFKPYVGKEYLCKEQEKSKLTKIVEGYF